MRMIRSTNASTRPTEIDATGNLAARRGRLALHGLALLGGMAVAATVLAATPVPGDIGNLSGEIDPSPLRPRYSIPNCWPKWAGVTVASGEVFVKLPGSTVR